MLLPDVLRTEDALVPAVNDCGWPLRGEEKQQCPFVLCLSYRGHDTVTKDEAVYATSVSV